MLVIMCFSDHGGYRDLGTHFNFPNSVSFFFFWIFGQDKELYPVELSGFFIFLFFFIYSTQQNHGGLWVDLNLPFRNRSRSAMTTKQQAYSSQSSPPAPGTQKNYKRQVPSLFGSPRFKAFTKALAETDAAAAISPTSILDTKQFSPFCNNNVNNPFWDHDIILNPPKSPKLFSENKHKGIGLALIDVLTDHKAIEENSSSVLFGTNLGVQIPPLPTQSPKSPCGSANSGTQTSANCTECLSGTEMELSEEYTCVISHGPNPKTTHIFDNCIIESYCSLSDIKSNYSAPQNFLSFCYTCKKNLEQDNDIYIYRARKHFAVKNAATKKCY